MNPHSRLRPYLPRLAAAILAPLLTYLARRYGPIHPDTVAALEELAAAIMLVLYGIIHRLLSRYGNPQDWAVAPTAKAIPQTGRPGGPPFPYPQTIHVPMIGADAEAKP